MLIGLYDEGQTFYVDPAQTFPTLAQLHVQVLRVGLYWGGPLGVATRRPRNAADPGDKAYRWDLYDRTVSYAAQYHIRILFSIIATPSWANGGKATNVAPRKASDLEQFAYAAAIRYSGAYVGPDGRAVNSVRLWSAWNEPNNPVFLSPQYRRVGGRWVIQSAVDYARICNAIYEGVHATALQGEQVGCGATAPRGNNNPSSSRPSVSPLAFLRAAKKAGLKAFDAWTHHPYYGGAAEQPGTKPPAVRTGIPNTAVTLANIGDLLRELAKLYGAKTKLWITEYGYQTNPPDAIFGVSWALQAKYLNQAYAIARANPRITMMLWFLLRDDSHASGWQSGLETAAGAKKPAFSAFAKLPH
jgi:hypothetical protein